MRLKRKDVHIEIGRILRLTWPVVLTSLNWTLLNLIDVALVGRASTHELATLGAGRTLTFITIVVGIAGLTGVLVFASRADGAGDRRACGDYLRQGLVAGLALGLVAAVGLHALAEPLVRGVGVAPDMVAGGARVVRAMAFAFPAQMLFTALSYFLEGISRPRRPMMVNLAMLPLNALLAWAWIGGHLGLPAEGAAGAAKATALVSAVGAVALLAATWMLPQAGDYGVRDLSRAAWVRAARAAPALLRFGIAPGLSSGLELAGFSWLIALSTQLGSVVAGAFQIMLSFHNFAFALGIGVASAAGVRVGNAVGAGETHLVRFRAGLCAALGMVAMGLVGLAYLALGDELVRLFGRDAALLAAAAGLVRMLAPFMLFDAVQITFVYALRSMGDQVRAGVNGIIAFFLVSGVGGWAMIRAGWGAHALVYATAGGLVVAAVLQGTRLWALTRRRPD